MGQRSENWGKVNILKKPAHKSGLVTSSYSSLYAAHHPVAILTSWMKFYAIQQFVQSEETCLIVGF